MRCPRKRSRNRKGNESWLCLEEKVGTNLQANAVVVRVLQKDEARFNLGVRAPEGLLRGVAKDLNGTRRIEGVEGKARGSRSC